MRIPQHLTWMILSLLCVAFFESNAQEELPQPEAEHDHPGEHAKPVAAVPWYGWDALFDSTFQETNYIDTTLTGLHQYDLYQRGSQLYGSKGNVGHAVRPLYFTPVRQGFHLHRHARYPYYLHTFENVRFHRPEHVYSELFFVLGSEREQNFYAKHNQRIHERGYGGF